jgi:tRNA pseudouridine55 synthase
VSRRAREATEAGDRFPDGIVLVDKEAGVTSFEIVRRVRRLSGLRRVGHAGTLDPFSTGLLILLLGRGTKLSPFLMAGRKRYCAEIFLGIETDTCDPEGAVTDERPVPDLDEGLILRSLEGFLGEIEQTPPAYSAVRVQGTRAYKLARKGIEVRPARRKVTIHEVELVSVSLPKIVVNVACSPGTYLRSLASDLGEALGTGAHLSSLRRTASGSHRVEDALDSGLLNPEGGRALLRERLVPMAGALPDMPAASIGEALTAKIKNGYHPAREEIQPAPEGPQFDGGRMKLLCDGELIAVVDTGPGENGVGKKTKIIRVFN